MPFLDYFHMPIKYSALLRNEFSCNELKCIILHRRVSSIDKNKISFVLNWIVQSDTLEIMTVTIFKEQMEEFSKVQT